MTRQLKWAVVRTAFHGGGIVSRHTTEVLAERAAQRYAMADCECGCAGVLPLEEVDALPSHIDIQDPYALAQ
jgi:hypothetical protein